MAGRASVSVFLALSLLANSTSALPPDAQVLKYLPDRGLVGISIGTDQGLREGMLLSLWRGGKQIGTCRVIKAGKIVAFCQIVSLSEGVTPKPGDMIRPFGAPPPKPPPQPKPQKPEKPAQPEKPKPPEGKPKKPTKESWQKKDDRLKLPSDQQKTTEKKTPPPVKVPALKPRKEELLAVGVLPREILVSSTEGVYVLRGASCRLDESVIPHRLLRFVPWGERIWAETDGGVFLRTGRKWIPFPWSESFGGKPAFARVTTTKDHAWGIYGRWVLVWDESAERIVLNGTRKRKEKGAWVRLGKPFPVELEAVLALNDRQLLLAAVDGSVLVKEGPRVAQLAKLSFVSGDPLVLELARDGTGVTWGLFFAEGGGLFSFGPRGLSVIRPGKELPAGRLLRLLTDKYGRVYVLHQTEGVFRHRSGRWERVSPRPPEEAYDIAIDGTSIFILTKKRLLRVDPDRTIEVFVLQHPE